MPARIFRLIVLPTGRTAALRASAFAAALAVVLVIVKLLKLPTGGSRGLFDGNLVSNAWTFSYNIVAASELPTLLLTAFLVAALGYFLARRSIWRFAAPLLALPIVYANTVIGSELSGDPQPWLAPTFVLAWQELREMLALWWRDILVVAVVLALLTVCYSLEARQSRRWVRIAAILVIAVPFVVAGLDFAYFLATRTQLTLDEVLYAVEAPRDALIAGKDAASWPLVLGLVALGLLLIVQLVAAAVILERRLGAAANARQANGRIHLGWILWPAVLLVIVAPPTPSNASLEQFADNAVTRFTSDAFAQPLVHWVTLRARDASSDRVPVLDPQRVSVAATPATRPLNVVIVMLESVRADATTLYSPGLQTTPFLAELARESLVADDMYAVVPRTSSAWIATLAGRYPAPVTVLKRWSSASASPRLASSLAGLLRTQGYASAFFTPTTLDFENEQQVIDALGFDTVVRGGVLGLPNAARLNVYGWEDRLMLGPMKHWLDERKAQGRPFLLTFMTNAAHYPYKLPADVAARNFRSHSPEEGDYLNSVRFLDDVLQDLVMALRERGLLEQTVLVVIGDHGEAFYEHGDFTHFRVIYEEALRVPLLIRLPTSMARQGRIGGLRQQIDVLPTVAEALGLELRGGRLPGQSLLSNAAGHETLFFSTHFDRTLLAMRAGNTKFIYNFGRRPMQVFDLARDRGEHADMRESLSLHDTQIAQADLLEWRDRVRASYELEERR